MVCYGPSEEDSSAGAEDAEEDYDLVVHDGGPSVSGSGVVGIDGCDRSDSDSGVSVALAMRVDFRGSGSCFGRECAVGGWPHPVNER